MGNVAVDVARILCRTPDELAATDIADYALDALRESRVREVVLLGRRGPLQAAFTYPEVKELGEMEDADILARPEEVALDPLSEAALEAAQDRQATKQVALLQDYAARAPSGKRRRIVLRFLVSPTHILGDDRVEGLRPRPTGETEEIDAGLVFRSVGYRGVALPGVPFDERRGIVPNDGGRVTDADGAPVPGLYVAGWIKRGPSGVIGTNKPDAHETANAMLEDADRGATLHPSAPDADAAERLVRARQPACFDYGDWRRLDAHEVALGEAAGRPRVKLTRVEDMLEALRRTPGAAG